MNARDRMERARALLIQDQPFFGVLALQLALVEDASCGTASTDGITLWYAPEFVMGLSDAELQFLLAHEAQHCALSHMARIGNRDLGEFNKAADYAINGELIRLKIGKMPAGGLHDPAYDGLHAEEIFAAMQAAKRKQKQDQQAGGAGAPQAGQDGQPQAGQQPGEDGQQGDSGQDGQPGNEGAPAGAPAPGNGQSGQDATGAPDASKAAAENGMGGIRKPGNGTEAECQEVGDKWQVIVRQAAAVAKAANAGDMPGFAERIISEISRPAVDYAELLAAMINSRIVVDYSFSRPNRRLISAGFYLPGTVADALDHLVFAVDTSGSIDQHMLANCAAEIVGAMETGKVRKLTVIFADAAVRHVQEFELGDEIKLVPRGGGGTRFSPTFERIERDYADATAVIYLTDMECNDFGREPECPVFWAVHGDSRRFDALAKRAPFGEAVYIGRLQ